MKRSELKNLVKKVIQEQRQQTQITKPANLEQAEEMFRTHCPGLSNKPEAVSHIPPLILAGVVGLRLLLLVPGCPE